MSVCGTRVGYQKHQADDTRPCPACLGANSDAVKASRIRRGTQHAVNIPVEVLRKTLEAHDCKALRVFLGEQITQAIHQAPQALER